MNTELRFRKKPVVIEAMQFTDEMKDRVFNWIGCNRFAALDKDGNPTLTIQTLEGDMVASIGDWVIKEPFATPDRQFYPCKPDIFEKTYEKVSPILSGEQGEKPDFLKMVAKSAFKSHDLNTENDVISVESADWYLEKIWNDHVTPLSKEIEELKGKYSQQSVTVLNAVDIIQIQISRLKSMPESRGVNTMIEDLSRILTGPIGENPLSKENSDLKGLMALQKTNSERLLEEKIKAEQQNSDLKRQVQGYKVLIGKFNESHPTELLQTLAKFEKQNSDLREALEEFVTAIDLLISFSDTRIEREATISTAKQILEKHKSLLSVNKG